MSSEDILLVAGEASGDLHGARLLSELRKLRPRLRAFGLGGDELETAGLDRISLRVAPNRVGGGFSIAPIWT